MTNPSQAPSPGPRPADLAPPAPSARLDPPNASQVAPEPPAAFQMTPAQASRLSRWGVRYRNSLRASWSGQASKRTAIQLQCLDCCGEDVEVIKTCADRCCPLWRYRPYQRTAASATHS